MHRQGEEKFLPGSDNCNPRVIPHKYLLSSFITSQQGVTKTALDFQTQIKIETCEVGQLPVGVTRLHRGLFIPTSGLSRCVLTASTFRLIDSTLQPGEYGERFSYMLRGRIYCFGFIGLVQPYRRPLALALARCAGGTSSMAALL